MIRCTPIALLGVALALGAAGAAQADTVWLDSLALGSMTAGWGQPARNRSVGGAALTVAGKRYQRGVGTHAVSRYALGLRPGAVRLQGSVGVDDEMVGHPGSVEFEVWADGKAVWKSGVLRVGDAAKPLDVDLTGASRVELVVTDGGNGIDSDHADWCDVRFVSPGRLEVAPVAYLSALDPLVVRPRWRDLGVDRMPDGQPLRVGETAFAHGFALRPGADLLFGDLGGRYRRLDCRVGATGGGLRVFADGRQVYADAGLNASSAAVSVDLTGVRELRLVADGAGTVVVGDPVLTASPSPPALPIAPPVAHTIRVHGLELGLSATGRIVSVRLGGKGATRPTLGATLLAGCAETAAPQVTEVQGGGYRFVHTLTDAVAGHTAEVTETFRPTANSVRWEVAVRSTGGDWSAPIQTRLDWLKPRDARFWTAWADSHPATASGWSDPLTPAPLQDVRLSYGSPVYREANPRVGYVPFEYPVFSIPLATYLDPRTDAGLSLILSPEDTMLEMVMDTGRNGGLTLSRLRHRLGPNTTVTFAMDLVAHEADCRGGLRWMVGRYPQYFDPAVAVADRMAGTGAYSTWEGDLDAEKLRKMAFRVNWKASFDFPYMGMFLPPVADDAQWTSFRNTPTSIAHLADYSASMRRLGFFVLSYFNVTEFGARVQWPEPPRKAADEADLWRDANDFLYGKLKSAMLYQPDMRPYGSWEGAVAMDPADPAYQEFLLEQARRHIEKIPEASGICIDRMDWLRLPNPRRDDGVTWVDDHPGAFLFTSWTGIMGKLGPLMHEAGKAIFVNNHVKRLEQLRYVDGLFDEFGYAPASINTTGLLGLHKTVVGWTADPSQLKPDPDAFFQRYLHMGIFPMAPFPGNDHSIDMDPWAEQQYMDHGPLLDAMRGKKWVLTPHAVAVERGPARANLFRTPYGWALPVTGGGSTDRAVVVLRGVPAARARFEALHPGKADPVRLTPSTRGDTIRLEVPLVRGCAMVKVVE